MNKLKRQGKRRLNAKFGYIYRFQDMTQKLSPRDGMGMSYEQTENTLDKGATLPNVVEIHALILRRSDMFISLCNPYVNFDPFEGRDTKVRNIISLHDGDAWRDSI